jgi:L-asparaginase
MSTPVVTPVVTVVATGGTISGVADAQHRSGGGLEAAAITGSVADRGRQVELRTVDECRVSSRRMDPPAMLALAHTVCRVAADGSHGVVVTHGTDTMEETAYLLALTTELPVPVVLTGAMRLPSEPGWDGPGNVAAAVVAACDPVVARLGPVVVFADQLKDVCLVS